MVIILLNIIFIPYKSANTQTCPFLIESTSNEDDSADKFNKNIDFLLQKDDWFKNTRKSLWKSSKSKNISHLDLPSWEQLKILLNLLAAMSNGFDFFDIDDTFHILCFSSGKFSWDEKIKLKSLINRLKTRKF